MDQIINLLKNSGFGVSHDSDSILEIRDEKNGVVFEKTTETFIDNYVGSCDIVISMINELCIIDFKNGLKISYAKNFNGYEYIVESNTLNEGIDKIKMNLFHKNHRKNTRNFPNFQISTIKSNNKKNVYYNQCNIDQRDSFTDIGINGKWESFDLSDCNIELYNSKVAEMLVTDTLLKNNKLLKIGFDIISPAVGETLTILYEKLESKNSININR